MSAAIPEKSSYVVRFAGDSGDGIQLHQVAVARRVRGGVDCHDDQPGQPRQYSADHVDADLDPLPGPPDSSAARSFPPMAST